MHFTKVQISELMRKHAEKENGLHDLMEIMPESMMVADGVSFCMKILKIMAMAIVLDMPMAKEENWNSVFPATVMATFIPGYLPFFAIRKRNVTGWAESYIPKDLRRNRSEMSLSRFTGSTIPCPASAGWPTAFVPR